VTASAFRRKLLAWYERHARDLPWRANRDPYRIWISEIMLQQTRVAAAAPYFERFLERFPDVESLARAPLETVLTAWSGLGYYSRARNLHRAAGQIVERGSFPDDYASIRRLPGVGEYTAAAVASIAFGLPYAAVDGNVRRVLSRLACRMEGLDALAGELLDRQDPGRYNQALMDLGATICLPAGPQCADCPVSELCQARSQGRQAEFPVRKARRKPVRLARTLLLVEKDGSVLLWKSESGRRLRGFWELPEADQLPGAVPGGTLNTFRHSITHHNYVVTVVEAKLRRVPRGFLWVSRAELGRLPLSTMAKKALAKSPAT
jgi:A/G-specific adenine glycosylase